MNFAFGKLQFCVRNKQPSSCCLGPHLSLRHHMEFSRFIVVNLLTFQCDIDCIPHHQSIYDMQRKIYNLCMNHDM